jgi:hypothetical protein
LMGSAETYDEAHSAQTARVRQTIVILLKKEQGVTAESVFLMVCNACWSLRRE